MSAPVRHLWVLIGNVIVPSLAWVILSGLGWFRNAAGMSWQEHFGAWAFMAMPLWFALILAWGRGSSNASVVAGFGLAYA